MLTQLQTRKLTHLFNLYDADGNGLLEKRDYARISQNGAHALGYQPGTAEYITLYTAYMGAGTQVLTGLPWALLLGTPGEFPRAVLMGAGWVINLAVAEWIIRKRSAHPKRFSLIVV